MENKRKNVTDEEFVEAYGYLDTPMNKLTQTQIDNRNIMRKVTNRYSTLLSEEDLLDCILKGLWRCLGYHREDKGQKFTTSLWRFTDWECKRILRKYRKNKNHPNVISITDFDHFDVPENQKDEDAIFMNECINLLPEQHRNLIRDYYFQKLTMEEIGKKHNFSKEAARQKINKALRRLREIYVEKS